MRGDRVRLVTSAATHGRFLGSPRSLVNRSVPVNPTAPSRSRLGAATQRAATVRDTSCPRNRLTPAPAALACTHDWFTRCTTIAFPQLWPRTRVRAPFRSDQISAD